MNSPYLEVTYRHGRPFAAYLHLFSDSQVSASRPIPHGMVLDFDAQGVVVGLEITAPSLINAQSILDALHAAGADCPAPELRPLFAA